MPLNALLPRLSSARVKSIDLVQYNRAKLQVACIGLRPWFMLSSVKSTEFSAYKNMFSATSGT